MHIQTYVNNIVAQRWTNMGSVSTASSVKTILRELYLEAMRQHIHASVGHIPGEDNKMADAASWITHLPDRKFLSNYCTHFPQSKTWRMLPLPSGCMRQLSTMLHNKQSPRNSLPPSSRKTPPPDANGGTSAAACKSPPTSRTLRNPFPSSKFSPSMSALEFFPRKGNLSRSNQSSNTSA